jgi:hypothetical protein
MNTKNIVVTLLALIIIGAVVYLLVNNNSDTVVVNEEAPTEETMPVEPDEGIGDGAELLPDMEETDPRGTASILGTSVNGNDIEARHFGEGETEVLLVAGSHGGYSPNTSALAEEAIAYFEANQDAVPEGVMLTIVPTLNPDGLALSGTPGRFNANDVDLNRNFDCEWSATGMWRDQEVSGGTAPFSEPESAALRTYVETYNPDVAVVYFAAEGKVYP